MCIAGYYPYPEDEVELPTLEPESTPQPEPQTEDNEDDGKEKRETPHDETSDETDDIKCPRYGSVSATYYFLV